MKQYLKLPHDNTDSALRQPIDHVTVTVKIGGRTTYPTNEVEVSSFTIDRAYLSKLVDERGSIDLIVKKFQTDLEFLIANLREPTEVEVAKMADGLRKVFQGITKPQQPKPEPAAPEAEETQSVED